MGIGLLLLALLALTVPLKGENWSMMLAVDSHLLLIIVAIAHHATSVLLPVLLIALSTTLWVVGILQLRRTLRVWGLVDLVVAILSALIFVPDIFGPTTMLIALLDSHEVSPVDFSSVKIAISGGSMVAPELVRRVKNTVDCGFSTVYGQTETSPVLTQTFPDDSEEDICNTVGQPLPNKDIAILDPKTSKIMPLNTIGEICSRGYCNMLRYNDNPEATKATIDEDGWLHTGDLGSMDERGYVKITGRLKEMIIRGGENLFPAEIENTLLEHPAIAEVAVVGIPDPKWGEIVGCFVRPVDATEPKIAELIAHCRQHLSPVKTPTKWMFVEEWPLTGSGKIQKFKLLENFEQGMYQEQTA
jgi:fatty-acyl-CoA synthase